MNNNYTNNKNYIKNTNNQNTKNKLSGSLTNYNNAIKIQINKNPVKYDSNNIRSAMLAYYIRCSYERLPVKITTRLLMSRKLANIIFKGTRKQNVATNTRNQNMATNTRKQNVATNTRKRKRNTVGNKTTPEFPIMPRRIRIL